MLEARRKQFSFRLLTACIIFACYGSLLGWKTLAAWLAIYLALQVVELCYFFVKRPRLTLSTPATDNVALIIIALNSCVFGSLAIIDVLRLDAWGSACH